MGEAGMKRDLRGNRRTALVLAAVALVFFIAIILKYWLLK